MRLNVVLIAIALIALISIALWLSIARLALSETLRLGIKAVNPYTSEVEFDGVIPITLTINAVRSVVRGDVVSSVQALNTLSTIPMSSDLRYLRDRVVKYLKELVESIRRLKDLENTAIELLSRGRCDEAREYVHLIEMCLIEAYSARYRLIEERRLDDFVNKLSRYIWNASAKPHLLNEYLRARNELVRFLEDLRTSTLQLLSDIELCRTSTNIVVSLAVYPSKAFGGDYVKVLGRVRYVNGTPIPNATLILRVVVEDRNLLETRLYTDESGSYRYTLRLPEASQVKGVSMRAEKAVVKGLIQVLCLADRYTGFNETEILIIYEKPRVRLSCPKSIELNRDLVVELTFSGNYTVRGSVIVNNKLFKSIELVPGSNSIVIPTTLLIPGINIVEVDIGGHDRFLRARYACRVHVEYKLPRLVLSVNEILLYPFNSLDVYSYAIDNHSRDLQLLLYLDNNLIARRNLSHGVVYISKPLPPTVLIGQHMLRIEIVDTVKNVSTVSSYRIVVLNPITMAIIVVLTLLTVFMPGLDISVVGALILSSRTTPHRVSEVQRVAMWVAQEVSTAFQSFVSGIRFRVARLVMYYRAVVRILARIVGEPLESETLREYMHRVESKVRGRVANLFRELTLLVEKDLYSRTGASYDEELRARQVAEEIWREVGER